MCLCRSHSRVFVGGKSGEENANHGGFRLESGGLSFVVDSVVKA